jgi:hypothetical protein
VDEPAVIAIALRSINGDARTVARPAARSAARSAARLSGAID